MPPEHDEDHDHADESLIKGQIAQYMQIMGARYGYFCTYNQLILLRQVKDGQDWVLEVSPVFRSYNESSDFNGRTGSLLKDSVSLREALFVLIGLSLEPDSTDLDNDDQTWFGIKTHATRSTDKSKSDMRTQPGQADTSKSGRLRQAAVAQAGKFQGRHQIDDLIDGIKHVSLEETPVKVVFNDGHLYHYQRSPETGEPLMNKRFNYALSDWPGFLVANYGRGRTVPVEVVSRRTNIKDKMFRHYKRIKNVYELTYDTSKNTLWHEDRKGTTWIPTGPIHLDMKTARYFAVLKQWDSEKMILAWVSSSLFPDSQ